jgi:hypothetical protein
VEEEQAPGCDAEAAHGEPPIRDGKRLYRK